jgi:hypothetical protein
MVVAQSAKLERPPEQDVDGVRAELDRLFGGF